jgi:hypothetical protein
VKFALLLLLTVLSASAQQSNKTWREILDDRIAFYGHRNWIVVTDSAYPLQSNPGIETIRSNESPVETVRHVLVALSKAPHLRPVPQVDKELNFVNEEEAPGIGAYRQLLSGIFAKHLPDVHVQETLHEEIIRQLGEASRAFNVLIIKTNMALPYTSVFFELRAGYWTDDAERRLRENIK